ncbi:hypothetical protein CTAYLR_001830 [Chrysophaeum taylorii]|uniref:Oxidoreductase-like domain-containing protein n=1 Tax=Chrysophaeum taylorii TaxID=2483200 RepID=A0AAD7U9V8_9STRA|nr:hypothetical protein CTAYLR_001830 [Chrysophaeum taylorii]
MIFFLTTTLLLFAEPQIAKLFGRFADKKLLLDVPGAGTPDMKNCCHGGCDNCDFSRVFDEMNAGRPKWVACYAERELIDGRRHEAPWKQMFEGDVSELSAHDFVAGVKGLPFRPSMGPKLKVAADDPPDDDEFLLALYEMLLPPGAAALTAGDVATGLQRITGVEHGAMWKDFCNAFVVVK